MGSKNRLSELTGLDQMLQLEHVFLADNRIDDISPMSSLSELREIDLSNNELGNIDALSQLTNVWRLNLDRNRITNIDPLLDFGELESVSLMGNPNLPCGTLRQLINRVGEDAVKTDTECI